MAFSNSSSMLKRIFCNIGVWRLALFFIVPCALSPILILFDAQVSKTSEAARLQHKTQFNLLLFSHRVPKRVISCWSSPPSWSLRYYPSPWRSFSPSFWWPLPERSPQPKRQRRLPPYVNLYLIINMYLFFFSNVLILHFWYFIYLSVFIYSLFLI